MTHCVGFQLADEAATVKMGNQLAVLMEQGAVIYLHGDLGAGKTTLTRGVIQGFGHQGKVKSPTYTLVEPYELATANVYHFDLYRLGDPEELEYMGIPTPDLDITLRYVGDARAIEIQSISPRGHSIVDKLKNHSE